MDEMHEYLAARAEFDAARKRGHEAGNRAELSAAQTELATALDRLQGNSHYQWLKDVQRDEMAAYSSMMARLPRCVTEMLAEDDGGFADLAVGQPDLGPAVRIQIDARRVSAKDAAELLRAAAARIDADGMLVSVVPSPSRDDGFDLWVNERIDGSLVGQSFRRAG